MKVVLCLFCPVMLSIWWYSSNRYPTQQKDELSQNQPPMVSIISPEPNGVVKPGQQLTYSIEVSDAEDGSTKYQEIPFREVFMEIRHFNMEPPLTENFGNSPENNPGLFLIREGACFDCHQWKTELVGPAFSSIALKYRTEDTGQLVTGIIKGSVNKWGNEQMPAQDFSPEQTKMMVEWLLENGKEPGLEIQQGLSGLFRANPDEKQGYYLLTASYRDHGIGKTMENRLMGIDSVVLTIDNE